MNSFHAMGLHPLLLKSFEKLNYQIPTPIQEKTIPLALQGKDILGSAKTGTGKTLAFAAPLIAALLENPEINALVLVPTRELAQQVLTAIKQLTSFRNPISTALLIGGDPYARQLSDLKRKARIVVGTPGRVIDHLERKSYRPDATHFLVLDEMDRMFDMGFGIQLEQIVNFLPQKRQTLMFTATLLPKIEKLAAKYLQNPERIFMDTRIEPALNLTQETVKLKETEKYDQLIKQLGKRDGSILVFVKTKNDAEKLANNLEKADHSVAAIHGDLRQRKRESVLKGFRKGHYRIMVATDIASRGLDIPHIQHVINYDLPHTPEDYVHRIGRTARAGASGIALDFISPQDSKRWRAIQSLMNNHSNENEMADHEERPFKKRASSNGQGRKSFSKNGTSQQRESSNTRRNKKPTDSQYTKKKEFTAAKSDGNSTFERKPSDKQYGKRKEFTAAKNDDNSTFERKPSDKQYGKRKEFTAAKSNGNSTFGKKPSDKQHGKRKEFTSSKGENRTTFEKARKPFKKDFGKNIQKSQKRVKAR